MKKQIFCLFLLTILGGYCHYGWSVPLDVTYNIFLDYDSSTHKFIEKKFEIKRQISHGSDEVETLDNTNNKVAKLILPDKPEANTPNDPDNPYYPIKLNNTMESIAGQKAEEIIVPYEKGSLLQSLYRSYSQFDLTLTNNRNISIKIKNAIVFSSMNMNISESPNILDPRKGVHCEEISSKETAPVFIKNSANKDCMKAQTASMWLTGNRKIVGTMKFVFDHEKTLVAFFDTPLTPAGLYSGEIIYNGNSFIKAFHSEMAGKENYKFIFDINKLPPFNYKWHGTDFRQKEITITRGNNTDIIVSGRKLFTIGKVPLETLVFNMKSSSVGAAKPLKGCGNSQFLLVNEQAKTQAETKPSQTGCIPYKLHLTNLTCMSRIPLSNGQDKKIRASRGNIFIGALDFSFVVHCADFTDLNSGLRRSLRTRNRQKTRIKNSTYNQVPNNKLADTHTLDLKFNVDCGTKKLTFKNSLIADVLLTKS